MSFAVIPDSNPPTNVHVLIGRNGTGKTSLIKNMIHSIRGVDTSHGRFYYADGVRSQAEFANVLCVAFSPFDDFSELETIESAIPYSYIGLNKTSTDLLQTIERQFLESFTGCSPAAANWSVETALLLQRPGSPMAAMLRSIRRKLPAT